MKAQNTSTTIGEPVKAETLYLSQSARDAQACGQRESYCLELERSAFELHGFFRAKGDWKQADEMLKRGWPECCLGNDGA